MEAGSEIAGAGGRAFQRVCMSQEGDHSPLIGKGKGAHGFTYIFRPEARAELRTETRAMRSMRPRGE